MQIFKDFMELDDKIGRWWTLFAYKEESGRSRTDAETEQEVLNAICTLSHYDVFLHSFSSSM